MKFITTLLIFGVILVIPLKVQSANILFYQLLGSTSHKMSVWPLAKELARKGHNVTFITKCKPLEIVNGVTEINPTLDFEMRESSFKSNGFMDRVNNKFLDSFFINFPTSAVTLCEQFLNSREFKYLKSPSANGNVKFDMVIIDPCFNECILGAAYLHKSIIVYFGTTGFYPFNIKFTDNPSEIPYKAAFALHYPDNEIFINRFLAVIETAAWNLCRYFYMFPIYNKLFAEHYGKDIPDVTELESKVALSFLNTHYAVDLPIPHTPSIIDVGCMHCKPAGNITDKKIKKFLDESEENGFIFFSLGSFVSETQMPTEYQNKLLEVFGRLKQRVLWKWDGSHLEGKIPKNVMTAKWVSQSDVLDHPNIRVFVSHGGKLSTEETVYHGVPVIVMPMFGDQEFHAHLANVRGYGRKFGASDLMIEDKFFQTISEIIENKSYKESAMKWSFILRDQLNDPLKKAVYWTEYLLRHNGAPHLQSNVKEFTYFQYYLIDVYAFIFAILTIVLTIPYFAIKSIFKVCYSKPKKIKHS